MQMINSLSLSSAVAISAEPTNVPTTINGATAAAERGAPAAKNGDVTAAARARGSPGEGKDANGLRSDRIGLKEVQ